MYNIYLYNNRIKKFYHSGKGYKTKKEAFKDGKKYNQPFIVLSDKELKNNYKGDINKYFLNDIQGGDLPEVETAYKRTFLDKTKYFVKKNKYYFIGGASLLVLLLAYKKLKK